MPLTKEERRALAVRVRLGEEASNRTLDNWWTTAWMTWENDTNHVHVLGTYVARVDFDSPTARYEDGTVQLINGPFSRSVLEYLEKD